MRSIQSYARLGGVLFVISIVVGGFGEGVAPTLLTVSGDAAATAHNIVTSDLLLRTGFAAYLVEGACDAALTVILYVLLRPVSRVIAMHVVVFRIMATATFAFAEVFYIVPTLILGGDEYLKSFTPDQLNSLALLSLNVYGSAGEISLVFYGLGSIGVGYLIYRSGYLPRVVGALWVIGGVCFVARTFAFFLAPGIPSTILQLPMIVAIAALAVWLLARGIDVPIREAKARVHVAL